MSTAAEPRRPSPANMPRRPAASDADRALLAPATVRPGTNFRALYERGILTSRMVAHHKLVAIALATHADAAGTIPANRQPHLLGLVHETGLASGQVAVALTALRQRGWVRQTDQRARYETADLIITIPKSVMAALLKRSAAKPQPSN